MRPIYENQKTLEREHQMVIKICDKWSADPVKLPIAYNIDYALTRNGDIVSWIEAKCRYCTKDQYDTYFISLKKLMNGIDLAEKTRKPFILVVQWTDVLGWVMIDKHTVFDVRIGGRKDRDDWQDVEPMAHLNTQLFTLI